MQVSVKLQDMASYSIWLLIAGILLIVLPPLIYFLIRLLKMERKPKKKPEVQEERPLNEILSPAMIKLKYTMDMMELETQCRQGTITVRDAYQKLSMLLRQFVHDISGVPAEKMTLEEIRDLSARIPGQGNIPQPVQNVQSSQQPMQQNTQNIPPNGQPVQQNTQNIPPNGQPMQQSAQDTQNKDISSLEKAIADCYVPEFAVRTTSDVMRSIENGKKVIAGWKWSIRG